MNINLILKWYLMLASIYLIGDGLVHVLNLKLTDIWNTWPQSATLFTGYISLLYGMFEILAACFGIQVSFNLKKYSNFLYITSFWGVVYGAILIYYSLNLDFPEVFKSAPSLYFWLPFYNSYIIFEAGLLFALGILTYIWYKKNHGQKN